MLYMSDKIMICDHPLIKHKTTILRNKNTETCEFRSTMQELSMLIAYEAMRNMKLASAEIHTPIERSQCPILAGNEPVLIPILRAGLGMSDGIIKLTPDAIIGHIGVTRDKNTLEAKEYLCKMPSSLDKRQIYAMDPMLATGGSASVAIDAIKKHGGKDITFLCIIAAPKGLEALHSAHPDIRIVVGSLDRDMNEHGFVSPGFGNAGDRYFGTN